MSELVYDSSGSIARYVAAGLKLDPSEMLSGHCLAIVNQGRVFGGVVFSDYRENDSAWISIYTNNKRWCTRKCLKQIFGFGFEVLKCRRLNALVRESNRASVSLTERCGFVPEGKMRQYFRDGEDVLIFGMLREECQFINQQHEGE